MKKTQRGKCESCCLELCDKLSNFYATDSSSKDDVNTLIVCDLEKDLEGISAYILYSGIKKYFILNNCMCKSNGNSGNSFACCYENIKFIKSNFKNLELSIMINDKVSTLSEFVCVKNVQELISYLNSKKPVVKESEANKEKDYTQSKNYCTFKIPEKYYTSDYRLVDIQSLKSDGRILYIFRDKDNNKVFYEYFNDNNDFYWYEAMSSNKIIENIDNLKLIYGTHRDCNKGPNCYGSDMQPTVLHSVDYFLNNKEECPVKLLNVMFLDIEVFMSGENIFPEPAQALYPISAVSFRTDDPNDLVHVYLLKIDGKIDPKIDDIIKSKKYPHLTIFDNEKIMIESFFAKVRQSNVDFFAGWNISGFDIPYIINRCKNLGIKPAVLSPYSNAFCDKGGSCTISGYAIMDQLMLYKGMTYITLPSYSLSYVAGVVLGKDKVNHEDMSIDEMYMKDIDTFCKYSCVDTELVYEIENKCRHISLQDELRKICTTNHHSAMSTLGQAEGLYATSMKKKGLVARNKRYDNEKEKIPGAYVFEARGGLYDGLLCDFDFTSLYPSIINTWNIGPDTYIARVNEFTAFAYIFDKDSLKNQKFEVTVDPIHGNKTVMMTLDDFDNMISKYKGQVNISGCVFCGHEVYSSINYTVLNMLMTNRKVYKKKMFDAKESNNEKFVVEYDGKQMAYKILANSLYGALANEYFRFYNSDLAKSITLTGQELLKYCTVHVDKFMTNNSFSDNFIIDSRFNEKVKSLTNVLYGDTDSMFVYLTDYLTQKGLEVKKSAVVQKEIDKIQDFTNKVAIPALLNKHNVSLKTSQIFLKNEYLFSKYYTLNGKKHYATKIISQEGRDINQIDIKGLEIKRSEIPPRSQKMLAGIIDIILSDIDKKDIKYKVDTYVTDCRKEMVKMINDRNNDIARVVSFSKLITEYKTEGRFPQHIMAMLMWNCISGSEDFRKGCKGKLWNILGIDVNKMPKDVRDNYYGEFMTQFKNSNLNCIAIPENCERLPDYFVVDNKSMIKYCCDDRAGNLLEPLWVEDTQLLTF